VATMLGVPPQRIVKTLLYETEQGLVAVVIRGDREVNEVKLLNFLGVERLQLAGEEQVVAATGAPVGFAGPVDLRGGIDLVADESVRDLPGFVCGANAADAHHVGCNWGVDATPTAWGDFVMVRGGDPCPRCDGTLEEFRGIEVGHIFKLGTKYSEPMQCTYLDAEGATHPMVMGCYGLGIGRTVAAAIEQNHDADGIVWPVPLAPFSVLLVALNPDDENVQRVAKELYGKLTEQGIDVLFDDRDERPGVKFKDADLIGLPVRVVVGAKSLADGKVELSLRRDRERQHVEPGAVVERVQALLQG
jgi:prolyl-tRNA synthetase